MGKPGAPRLPAEIAPISQEVADAPLDLDRLAQQLSAIAEQLRDHDSPQARDHRRAPGDSKAFQETTSAKPNRADTREQIRQKNARIARAIYDNRRKRDGIFGTSELFGEPAWDILLDLYVAEAEGKAVSVSSACIGSASPSTTGLRWLGVLSEAGLVAREHDPEDQRRVLVRLSAKGLEAMDRYFDEVGFAP
ncbi:winged helix DNA-binding protein [Erythrobacter sp. THAF29]|uniref:winged helix DNA-binding protein n=1 Tax=Erythrobacter sp. THAF29 TaxID=2587851 RepID=UPI001268F5DD|nr:winged helix DNA-binding protein [Erythrobacter sp. THAF29]QFT77818.1 hypothetical protein FIU90_09750 [Erythrobacter sp. THAF29]